MNRTCLVTACFVVAFTAAPPASAQTDLGKRVTIDVTEVAPQKVFEMLGKRTQSRMGWCPH